MELKVRRADYYYTTVNERPAEAYSMLTNLAELGVNFVALTLVPMGPDSTQLTLFPEDAHRLVDAARKAGLALDGPHAAILVQGDDQLGALASIHAKLHEAGVEVFMSSGVTDGRGFYGYTIYVRPEHAAQAAKVLEVK